MSMKMKPLETYVATTVMDESTSTSDGGGQATDEASVNESCC
jgi:hypothetical protein